MNFQGDGSSPSISVRQAQETDLAAIIRMENRCFTDPWSPETLFGELSTDRLRLPLVAEQNGTLCGYIMAWIVVDQLHVLNIATDPDYQRQGVATALLQEAVRLGRPRGTVEVTLEVRASNHSARAFYLRHGFDEVGLRPGYYQDNGEDAIVMTAPCEPEDGTD